jgi:hypothetical protein
MHCALDFGETEAFSSDVILKRTKTLMQGDDCCDHCYTLKKQELPKNDVGVVPHKVFMILDLIVPPNLKNQDYLSEVFYDTNYTPSGG